MCNFLVYILAIYERLPTHIQCVVIPSFPVYSTVKGQPSGSVRVLRPTVEIRLIIGTGNIVYLNMYRNVWTCVLPRGPRHMGLPSSRDGL